MRNCPQDEIIYKEIAAILLICFAMQAVAFCQQDEIEPASDVYRLIPLRYDGQTGVLTVEYNDAPYLKTNLATDKLTFLVAINDWERQIEKVVDLKGKAVMDGQKFLLSIGYNVTTVKLCSDVGFSAEWKIAGNPIGLKHYAIANPTKYKSFWVLGKNVPSSDAVRLQSLVVDQGTYYEKCKGRLAEIGYDNAKPISLPVAFSSVVYEH